MDGTASRKKKMGIFKFNYNSQHEHHMLLIFFN